MNLPLSIRTALFAALLAVPAGAFAKVFEIQVDPEITNEGRMTPVPSKEAPSFYLPIVVGYSPQGDPIVGEKEPPQMAVIQALAKALASQNYLVSTARTPPPNILLMFAWGYMNAPQDVAMNFKQGETTLERRNQTAAAGWVATNATPQQTKASDQTGEFIGTNSHYYVMISAYDYQAYQSEKKKVLLWRVRTTSPMPGTTFEQIMGPMLEKAAPTFGRDPKAETVATVKPVEPAK